ncbi:polyol permease family [Amycolatopsis lexingtonensis]|uniref:Polyol permease family n=1 Tax=Amycolatopsis lexingtonensis TaxID=218822 RepID=A0ABR9HSN4_9PSEU|nr:MFS transporter [Amycolatopsis lexingtonensis]MBE1493940.1 polyol permease family [Amycolatopsis lexingtonensis]
MSGFWARQGIVPNLRWGFAALTLFMVGDGIESGFLSPFLDERGFGSGQVSLLWGVYGLVVAVAAWLAGALAETFGPKRVMLTGFAVWVLFEVAFLLALARGDFGLMVVTFGVRGLGYPLFSYGFLVWVAMETPQAVLGKAVGWYWFFAMLGLGVLGSYYAGFVIPLIGEFATLASSLAFIGVGGLMVALLVKARGRAERGGGLRAVLGAVTIVFERPKVGIGGIVRVINTLGFYAFVVFLTTYMVRDVGLSTAEWQTVWGTMLLVNVLANVVFGYVADRIGRVRTVAWCGGLACAVSVPALYHVPHLVGPNFWAILGVAVVYGAALAGFVPLSAILPSLAPQHVGGAVAILNLGAGVSQFLGPAVAGLVGPLGVGGTVWVIAGTYVLGIGLTYCLRDRTRVATTTHIPERTVA